MNDQQSYQQPKFNPKGRIIASLVLSVLSFSPFLLGLVCGSRCFIAGIGGLPIFLMTGPLAIIGLSCGILSLKSTRKSLAVIGIIFSLIGLGTSIFLYLLSLMV